MVTIERPAPPVISMQTIVHITTNSEDEEVADRSNNIQHQTSMVPNY